MFKKGIWSFDTLLKCYLLKLIYIYKGYNNVLSLNIQYRLTKNTYNPDNCIRGSSRTSRNLFRVTNIGVSHWNSLPSNIINSTNLKHFPDYINVSSLINIYILYTYFNLIIYYLVFSFTFYHVTIIYYFIKHDELEIKFRFIFLYYYQII